MKNQITLAVVLLVAALSSQSALAQPKQGWFDGGYASVDFDKTLGVSANTTDFVKNSFIGIFALDDEYYFASFDTWSLRLTSYIQFLWGGIKERKAKLYAGSFDISLAFKHKLPFYNMYFQAAAYHVSTHYIDPIDAASISEAIDLQQISIQVRDVNVFRFDVGQEESNYAWLVGVQPIQMNFFLLGEPKEMFSHEAYVPYERRFYGNAIFTAWRNDDFRLAVEGTTEMEQGLRYRVRVLGSLGLGDTPRHDRIQLGLSYQGGIKPNQIVVIPGTGIAREGLSAHATFYL